jgi:hypothetical protein
LVKEKSLAKKKPLRFAHSGSFLEVRKKQAKIHRTFIKLEIPAKLPAKNSLYQVKTVKGDLLWELSLFEYLQIESI